MANTGAQMVARLLRELGQRVALSGDNPFRSRAYLRAADILAALPVPLEEVIAEGALTGLPGVGDTIADIITKLHAAGSHPSLERLRQEMPAGVLELFNVPGLRPEQIMKLHRELGIASLAELESAASEGLIGSNKKLGPALQRKVLQNLGLARTEGLALHLHRAAALLEHAQRSLKTAHPEFRRIEVAGDFRRGCELVTDLALVAEADRPGRIDVSDLRVIVADKRHFGARLLDATGSQDHLRMLQRVAGDKGYRLEPDGLFRGTRLVAAATEEKVYRMLGLEFIEPELRERRDEIARATRHELPELVRDSDLRGVLHCHTVASDGAETLEAMAEATRQRGYQYFGVADHSRSARYAGGLSVGEIKEQQREADRLNQRYGRSFRILKGIEADILADGSLDYPDEILRTFDFVVASVHSRFQIGEREQTARVIRAVESPYTTILGHLTGRQLLRRPGYDIDVDRVLKACANCGVAVEINAHPWRLDLDWRWHEVALQYGCLFSINPDAHSIPELDHVHWGVEMARKGSVPAARVLNAMSLERLLGHLGARSRSMQALNRRP